MQLNLPILDHLSGCRRLLIAGMGGGFDLFCGLPIYFALRARGMEVHLANLTFSDLEQVEQGQPLSDTLVGVTADTTMLTLRLLEDAVRAAGTTDAFDPSGFAVYFPERYLAEWFRSERGEEVTIWCLAKTGVRPLRENYRRLVAQLGIDGLLLIDGGVDALMRGDEAGVGTFIEDAVSLAAVDALDEVPVKLLACVGLGAEQDIAYAHVFENIAALTGAGAFLGSCALTPQMPAYQAYEAALLAVQGCPWQEPSVINSSIVSAVQGHYGNVHLTAKTKGSVLWISPLMPLYWFFDLPAVARRSLVLPYAQETETFRDAVRVLMLAYREQRKRPAQRIPLP